MAVPDPPASAAPAADAAPASHRATARPAVGSSAVVTAATAPYVTRPTRWTIFLRTFVPWQLWRFARINLKMIRITRRTGG
jgi:hypothetical protein